MLPLRRILAPAGLWRGLGPAAILGLCPIRIALAPGAAATRSAPAAPLIHPALTADLGLPLHPAAPARPAAVLYDQLSTGDTGITSQAFEPAYAAYDSQAADDFVVPAGETWAVGEVYVRGGFYGGTGPVDSVNVFFYANQAGTDPLPGAPVFTQTGILADAGSDPGDLLVPLNPPALLPAGTYWVSVQARLDLLTAGQWYWRDAAPQTGGRAAWRNPAGGWNRCRAWAVRQMCDGNFMSVDQAFSLLAVPAGTPWPTPTTGPTRTPVPVPPTATGTVVLPCPILTQPPALPTASPPPACGLAWRDAAPADAPEGDDQLNAVASFGPGDAWAAGWTGAHSGVHQPVLEHWDGAGWAFVPGPPLPAFNGAFSGLAGTGPDDIWAAGYQNNGFLDRTLTAHWDGTAWAVIPSPNVGPNENHLLTITALAPDDVWAGGYFVADATTQYRQALALHWDGVHWTTAPLPVGGFDSTEIDSLSGSGPDDVWAVGPATHGYNSATLILHRQGDTWTLVNEPPVPGYGAFAGAVAALSPSDVWLVGTYEDYTFVLNPYEAHWDGNAWTVLEEGGVGNDHPTYLTALAAAGPDSLWAAGSYNGDGAIFHPLLLHWDGSAWQPAPVPDRAPLNTIAAGIAAAGPADVWAAGWFQAGCNRTYMVHYSDPCAVPSPTPVPPSPTPTHSPTAGPSATAGPAAERDASPLGDAAGCHGDPTALADASPTHADRLPNHVQ